MENPSDFSSVDFDFRHNLYNTIILLGGEKEIALLLKKSADSSLTETDLSALQNYNIQLFTEAKLRLANLPSLRIRVRGGLASKKRTPIQAALMSFS
jgi:hypothetical protein